MYVISTEACARNGRKNNRTNKNENDRFYLQLSYFLEALWEKMSTVPPVGYEYPVGVIVRFPTNLVYAEHKLCKDDTTVLG